jgi:hypothetical protein
MDDEVFYDRVATELANGEIRAGLWAKALEKARGRTDAARAAYIRLRVRQLKAEEASASTQGSREPATTLRATSRLSDEDWHARQKIGYLFLGLVAILVVVLATFGAR